MSRITHVSEPKWGDDPDDVERFEERQQKDLATMVLLCLVLIAAAALVVLWWAIVSTVSPGSPASARISPGIS